MMLDVDFAICTAVRERFRDALAVGSAGETSEVGDLARSGRAAFVIPAFEYVVQDEGKDWKTFPKDKQVSVGIFHPHSQGAYVYSLVSGGASQNWNNCNVSPVLGSWPQQYLIRAILRNPTRQSLQGDDLPTELRALCDYEAGRATMVSYESLTS